MWSKRPRLPGIQRKSSDVLRTFLASFSTTKTPEGANAESIEAKILRFYSRLLQHLFYLAVGKGAKYAEQFVLEHLLFQVLKSVYARFAHFEIAFQELEV
jgi:hypothetical protein